MRPYFVLEGPDGSGKSMQADLLAGWLRRRGRAVLHLREPGSTPLGEALRGLLLDPATGGLSPLTEALLFSAARLEMLEKEVKPALDRGEAVVVERCYLSTAVYQGLAADPGVSADALDALARQVHGDCWPARIFCLDVDVATARERRNARAADRFEARAGDYQERVRRGFLALAARDPRVQVVDGARPPDQVHAEIAAALEPLLAGGVG